MNTRYLMFKIDFSKISRMFRNILYTCVCMRVCARVCVRACVYVTEWASMHDEIYFLYATIDLLDRSNHDRNCSLRIFFSSQSRHLSPIMSLLRMKKNIIFFNYIIILNVKYRFCDFFFN